MGKNRPFGAFARTSLIAVLLFCMVATSAVASAATSAVSGEIQPTLRLADYRAVSITNGNVSIPGWNQTPVGPGLSLPAQTRLLELRPGEGLVDISITAESGEWLGSVPYGWDRDLTTSSDPSQYQDIQSATQHDSLGCRPVQVVDQLTVGETRYALLMVLPVVVEDNHLTAVTSVTIGVGERVVEESDLLSPEFVLSKRSGNAGRSSSGEEYLIVTSELLREPFETLAEYRRRLGVRTRVVVVDEFIAGHTGRDTAEQLREALKGFYADGGRYLLLGGDETQLPVRYAYHYATYTQPTMENLQVCDLYFADLTGEWEVDGDGVWGEPYHDAPDVVPELYVGRLPFGDPAEVDSYVAKVIAYETNPGDGDCAYLGNAFFFSSDQMRDYDVDGQHNYIAQAYPPQMQIDTTHGVELESGVSESPTNLTPDQLAPTLSQGYGIVNIIAHGSGSGFIVRSSGYNNFPKAYMSTSAGEDSTPTVAPLESGSRSGFYYSLACSNGGFDRDQPPLSEPEPSLVQTLLAMDSGGAVGMVAYSRWGWVGLSHKLQAAFFESLFAHPELPAVAAMYESKASYYGLRDLVYGQNYFGDPLLRVYTAVPERLSLAVKEVASGVTVTATADSAPVAGLEVNMSAGGDVLMTTVTDGNGEALFAYEFSLGAEYCFAAQAVHFTTVQRSYLPKCSDRC